MTRLDQDDEPLTKRLGQALEAEARRHSLPAGYPSSLASSLPERTPRGFRSLATLPAVAATVVLALAAVALVLAVMPRMAGPAPGSSEAPQRGSPLQTPDPRAVIECQLPEGCDEVASAATALLPGGESTWTIIAGRSRFPTVHAEVHACYPDGSYFLVDVFDFADATGPTASLRAERWQDPPCRDGLGPTPSASPSPIAPLPVSLSTYASEDMHTAAVIGRLRESGGCLFIGSDRNRLGLSWPAGTSWDPVRQTLTAGDVEVRLGQVVLLGGGPLEVTTETIDRMTWVAPPRPECLGDSFWLVGDVVPDPPLPSQMAP